MNAPRRIPPGQAVALPLVLGVLGTLILATYTLRYPLTLRRFDAIAFGTLDPTKLLASLRSVGVVLVLNLAAYGLGQGCQRLLRGAETGASGFEALFRLGYGFLILPHIVLLLAALQLLSGTVLSLTLLVPAGVTLAVWIRARSRRFPSEAGVARATPPASGKSARLLLALVLAVVLSGPLLEALGPRVGWDALTYHLALPERYLRENAIVVTPYSLYSAFPGAMEMLYTLLLGVGDDVAAKLLHFELGLLTLWALAALGRRFSPSCSVLAPFILLAEPLFLQEMTWAYNDLNGAFYTLLAVGTLLDWKQRGERIHLVRCGLFAGACVATRALGGSVVLGLCAALWLSPGPGWFRSRVRASLWLGGVAFLVLAPWLIRNAMHTGNPVAPALQGVFHAPGQEYFDPTAVEQNIVFDRVIGMGRSFGALLALPWNLTLETRPGVYGNSFGFRISPMYLVGLFGVLLVGWRRRSSEIAFVLKFTAVFTVIWFFTFQEPRFLLPIFPLLCLTGAWAFDQLPARRWVKIGLLALPLYAVTFNALPGIWRWGRHFDLALGGKSHAEEMARFAAHEAGVFLRELLEPDDRLLLLFESRSYFFRGLDTVPYQPNEGPPVLQLVHRARTVPRLRKKLRELGVTHVLFNNRAGVRPFAVPGYGEPELEADLDLIRRLLQGAFPVYDRDGIIVVALEDGR